VSLQSEKTVLIGWLLFSTITMDPTPLKESISECIQDVLVGLCWKMITTGTQGQIKEEDCIHALHLYIDELDVKMAKPLLMALFTSCPSLDHIFPLHIQMHLVPKIDSVLNIKGWKNVEKLHACQNTWNKSKLVYIKMWEIELLDSQSGILGLSLWDVMMAIHHPTNPKFALFHLINKLWWETCYILAVLKSTELYMHAMILALLPNLQWKISKEKGSQAATPIAKWFKLEARSRAVDA